MLQARGQMQALGADTGGNAALQTGQAAMMLNADRGISGTMSKLGSSAMLQIKLMDYKTGRILSRASAQGSADDAAELLAAIPDALVELFKALDQKSNAR
jgi:hypothetical protein